MRNPTRLLAALAALAFSAPAMASVVWKGDFETGDHSQWSRIQSMGASRLQVVDSPVRQGQRALRVEVQQGDDPINASGNRNELVKFDGAAEGTEFYYGWSTLWPTDYPMTPNWQVFMQWHHSGSGGAPPVRFVLGCSASDCGQAMPDTMFLIVNGKTVWKYGPLTLGNWHDFVLHVKWSANPSVGFVELWYDGQLVLPKVYARTMFSSSDTNYLKMGLYRDEAIRPKGVLFHDALVQATTLEEAMAPALAADTGTPPADGATLDPAAPQEPGVADSPVQNPSDAPSASLTPNTSGLESGALTPNAGGCSAGAASSAPWAWLLGAVALLPLARMRRRASRRE